MKKEMLLEIYKFIEINIILDTFGTLLYICSNVLIYNQIILIRETIIIIIFCVVFSFTSIINSLKGLIEEYKK